MLLSLLTMASNVVILLLLLVLPVSEAKVFLSIDCGATDKYTDDKSIEWSPDDAYIKTGVSLEVSSTRMSSEISLNTLRVFKTASKSCYSINVDKGGQLLVRATFYYGNYDNTYISPSFDLLLNGKYWGTVVGDIYTYTFYEAIILVPDGVVSVCLVRTLAGQYPFITALELRSMDTNMYSHANSDHALYLVTREIGSSQDVRFPDDVYDRIWSKTVLTPISSSDTLDTISITLEDNPPVAALQGVVTSDSTETPISFQEMGVGLLPPTEVPILLKMYFAELDELDASDKRSFNVYIDSERLTSSPITPSYGIASEYTLANISASASSTFSLKATPDSTLPPIMNAYEIYTFSNDSDSRSYNGDDKNNSSSGGNGNGDDKNNGSSGGNGNGDDNNNNRGSGGNGNGDDSNKELDPSSSSSSGHEKSNKGTVVGVTVPFFFLWAVAGVFVIWQRKRQAVIITTAMGGKIAMGVIGGGATEPNDETPISEQHILRMSNNTSEG